MEKGKHSHVSIEQTEQEKISEALRRDYEDYLASYGVKFPKEGTTKFHWLIYLKKFQQKLVHKDEVASYVQENLPDVGRDQQVRHLAADGWYVLNKGDKIPNQ